FFGTQEVNTVAIDADSNLLVGGDFEGTITSWNLESKALHKTLSNRSFSGNHGGVVFAVDLSPTQHTIVSGSSDGSIKIWDRIRGNLKQILNGHTDAVRSVKISSDGKFLVSGSVDRTLRIWSLDRSQTLQTLTGHSGCVTSVDLSSDDRTIASGSTDRTVKLWDLQTGELRRTLTGHSSTVLSISIAPNGKTIATASSNEVIIWEIQTGECIQDLAGNSPVIFSPDGYRLVTGDLQNNLRIWQQSVRKKDDRSVLFGKWWKALGVNIDASLEEVKLAYRRLARLYHPDLNPSKEAIERMQALNKAYDEFLKGYTRSVRSI
ncbi:MAG: DnaJ domain-containing protein, partial [Geitlerinemataceae cyanobacterium]